VVDEAADVAHPVTVNDDTAVKMHAVMVTLVAILLRHTLTKLLFTHHLTHVLCYKLTYI